VSGGGGAMSAHWSAPFVPIVQSVVQQIGPAVMAWSTRQQAGGAGGGAGGNRAGHGGNDDRPRWEARELFDVRYAQQKGAAYRQKKETERRAAEEQAARGADEPAGPAAEERAVQEAAAAAHAEQLSGAIAGAWSPVLGLDVVKLLQLLPKRTVEKVMRVQGALSPDEQGDAMEILRRHDAEGLADLLGVFDAASVEESAGLLRRLIVDWRTTKAAATKAPTGGGSSGPTAP
jgi:hypothetical protein